MGKKIIFITIIILCFVAIIGISAYTTNTKKERNIHNFIKKENVKYVDLQVCTKTPKLETYKRIADAKSINNLKVILKIQEKYINLQYQVSLVLI